MNEIYKYDILEKHQEDELKRDPFGIEGLLKGFTELKGFPSMSHQKALTDYAQELVAQFALYRGDYYILSLEDLPENDQDELTRLYIESTDREVSDCIYGDDFTINSDFTCALLSMLKNNCELTREQFATITRKNILVYYKSSLEKILDEACASYFLSVNDSYYGYYADQENDYEEMGWSK